MLSKEDSKILKGYSILIMIWLHTFLYKNDVDSLYNLIFIGQTPLVTIIHNFCGICVFLYLFLGGYGLYITYTNKKLQSFRRIFFLYLNYWIVFALMIPIGCIIRPELYPGNLSKFILNLIAWDYSYNSSWWFLFPYILIMFTSGLLFKLLNKIRGWRLFTLTFFIYLITSYSISRYGDKYFFNNLLLYIPLLYFHLLNAFLTGAIFAKYNIFDYMNNQIRKIPHSNYVCIISIIGLILFKGYITTSIINIFVVCLLFILIHNLAHPIWLENVLYKLGEGSTNMWLVHVFICYYFMHDFTYSLKYPILVYFFVVVSSFIIHLIIKPIFTKCRILVNNLS